MIFEKARPVWGKGLQEEMHITCGFYTAVGRSPEPTVLRVATSGFYRVFVNGSFAYYGPVRCAHGHYRVDELPLTALLTQPVNHVAVEVVNYYVTAFASLRQPGFIQMELLRGGRVIAATAEQPEGFTALRLTQRLRRVQRYSFQRAFAESYRLHPDTDDWRVGGPSPDAAPLALEETPDKVLLPRELPLQTYPRVDAEKLLARGRVTVGELPAQPRRDRSLVASVPGVTGYAMEELETVLTDEVQRFVCTPTERKEQAYPGETALADGEYAILALPGERTGFTAMELACTAPTALYLLVDEILTEEGDVDPLRMQCTNIIRLELDAGAYSFLAMEPLGYRYIKLVSLGGAVTVRRLHMRELVHPLGTCRMLDSTDAREQAVFAAGWQTFRQSAADLFTDCPTRERAGWLCDSFFIGRAAQFFTGDTRMERQFLQNFLLPDTLPDVPEGMLPMCYPSDHLDHSFIVNWALWYVVQLYDYRERTGDGQLIEQAQARVRRLLDYLRGLENADGLLEHLPGWAFVEWSHANDLVQDINYPTNMVYSYVLRAAGRLYDDPSLTARGEALAETIRRRSFNGEFFTDNEVYRDGVPVSTGECTETCQYHAFFFGIATPQTYPALWQRLMTQFGPHRAEQGLYPEIAPANAFTGNFLRLDLLLHYGCYDRLREEVVGYFAEMAALTGTLWENMTAVASCNHGFASYAACLLDYAIRREAPYTML